MMSSSSTIYFKLYNILYCMRTYRSFSSLILFVLKKIFYNRKWTCVMLLLYLFWWPSNCAYLDNNISEINYVKQCGYIWWCNLCIKWSVIWYIYFYKKSIKKYNKNEIIYNKKPLFLCVHSNIWEIKLSKIYFIAIKIGKITTKWSHIVTDNNFKSISMHKDKV